MEQDKFKLASKNIALETKNFITKVDTGFFRLHRLDSRVNNSVSGRLKQR